MRIPARLIVTVIAAAALTLSACTGVVGLAHGDPSRDTGTVSSPSTPASPAPAATPAATSVSAPGVIGGAVSAVTVTFSDQVQQLAASDPRLTTDDIATAVQNELTAQHLYAPAAASAPRTLAISIENFSNSLTSNASVMGFTFRTVALTGDVRIKGDPAVPDSPFDIHARARLSSRDAGANAGSLNGLYARFAALTVAALRGVEAPEEPVPR